MGAAVLPVAAADAPAAAPGGATAPEGGGDAVALSSRPWGMEEDGASGDGGVRAAYVDDGGDGSEAGRGEDRLWGLWAVMVCVVVVVVIGGDDVFTL